MPPLPTRCSIKLPAHSAGSAGQRHCTGSRADRRDNKRAIVRLSGKFHTRLGDQAGNAARARSLRGLSMLTCLIISLHDAQTATRCRADEHSDIIDAIARRDASRAERLMLEHLSPIEDSLKLGTSTDEVDLETISKC